MGQKVHPYGFRLGTLFGWQSNWFAERRYGEQLHEDLHDLGLCTLGALGERLNDDVIAVAIDHQRREAIALAVDHAVGLRPRRHLLTPGEGLVDPLLQPGVGELLAPPHHPQADQARLTRQRPEGSWRERLSLGSEK